VLKKQFRTANERWLYGLGFQRGANDPNRKKPTLKKEKKFRIYNSELLLQQKMDAR